VEIPPALQRNLGWLTPAEQRRLAAGRAAVLGLGGVGGVAAELLARAGVGRLALCDAECFEPSDLNRQLGATAHTLGAPKAEAMAQRLAAVSPSLELELVPPVAADGEAARRALAGAGAGVLAIDRLVPALAALRAGRAQGVALVEALALPAIQVRAYAPDGPDPEEGLPSRGRPLESADPAELAAAYQAAEAPRLGDGRGGPLSLPAPLALAMHRAGAAPSLGPVVWLAGAAAALEALKILLGRGRVAWWPAAVSLDPWEWRLFSART
jgi:molybdopterin/thiamine biosynthesis adenylyltransferase